MFRPLFALMGIAAFLGAHSSVHAADLPGPAVPRSCGVGLQKLTGKVLFDLPGAKPNEISLTIRLKLEKLYVAAQGDPDVMAILLRLNKLTAGESPATWMATRLQDATSVESKVVNDYLEYVIHRPAKKAAMTAAEEASLRSLDPAMAHTRIDAILDGLMTRYLELDQPIPADVADALQDLFQGGAFRIQARADTWMLNGEVGNLVETEKILRSGEKIAPDALFNATRSVAKLDGGSPFGFQKPLRDGEWRIVPAEGGGVARADALAMRPGGSAALARTHASQLVPASDFRAMDNVMSQSPPARRAVAMIEARLSALAPGSAEYRQASEAYRAYLDVMVHDPHLLNRNSGTIDRLAEAVILYGRKEHQEAFIHFILNDADIIRKPLVSDFAKDYSYRDVYIGLNNLIRARESWDGPTLDYVFNKIQWLKQWGPNNKLPTSAARAVYEDIIELRRSLPPDSGEVVAALTGEPAVPTKVSYGPYQMKLSVAPKSAGGEAGKFLEVRDLGTSLPEDSEFWKVTEELEALAKARGYAGIQFADWRNIHEARVFAKRAGFTEVLGRQPILRDGKVVRTIEVPTYVRSFAYHPDPTDLNHLLDTGGSRGTAKLGEFDLSVRKVPVSFLPGKKALTLTLVDSANPGGGNYASALNELERLAKAKGYQTLVVEGVTDPRHWQFYEKEGFKLAPTSQGSYHTYYRDFK